MVVLRTSRPLWLDRSQTIDVARYPRLRRTVETEIAIVGGGITGTAAAWRFADAGLRTAVIEGARIGSGSTAASTALLMQEPDEDFDAMRRRYGSRASRRIWELSRRATAECIETLRQVAGDPTLDERDSIYYTLKAPALLRREHRLRAAAGLPAAWLEPGQARAVLGFETAGAIRTRGNAQADPYRSCLGLLAAARRRGAIVFERSPVLRIDASGRDGVVLRTVHGRVRARQVVIATGYATPWFRPLLARFRLRHTYVMATARLAPRERARIGLGDVMIWDTERPYHYARWTADGRLLLGGADRPRVAGSRRARALRDGIAEVRRYFEQRMPALAATPTEYAWEGLFATTPDGLPYIGPHRRYPRHLFALGYGGNGMTFGFLASALLLDRLQGRVTPDQDLFAFGRTPR